MSRPQSHRVSTLEALTKHMLIAEGSDMSHLSAARQLQAAANRMWLGAKALDSLDANKDPSAPAAAHVLNVARQARKYGDEAKELAAQAQRLMGEGLMEVRGRIAEKVDLKCNALAPELRQMLRGMDRQKQLEIVNGWVESNDGPSLAAVLGAPAALSGLHEEDKKVFGDAIIAKHAPAEFEEQRRLVDIALAVQSAANVAHEIVKSFTDPDRVATLEREEEAARKAGAEIDGATVPA